MKNSDNPAFPRDKDALEPAEAYVWTKEKGFTKTAEFNGRGLSKYEYACIHCGVPETGDPDLDAIIAKGNKHKAALGQQDRELLSRKTANWIA